jgi:FkbM family methyltransferase
MKNLIKSLVPVPLRRFAGRAGRFLTRDLETEFPSIPASLGVLKKLGFEPKAAIDVGAYHGEWSAMFKSLFPGATMLMIEAQESKRQALEAAARRLQPCSMEIALLGPEDGKTVTFCEMETGSSVYEEASGCARNYATRELITLDTLLKNHPRFQSADILKLDTQGYELEILKGCPALLRAVPVVLMETSLLPVNKGAPLIHEVLAIMSAHGFRLFDFCSQIRRTDGVLWQTDLLFVSERSPCLPEPRI